MPKGLIINCSLKGFDYFSSVLKTSLKIEHLYLINQK